MCEAFHLPHHSAMIRPYSDREGRNRTMRCRRCEADNPQDARFCDSCGAELDRACDACGASNRAGARFCNRCGSKFHVTARPTAAPASIPGYLNGEGERKLV